MIKGAATKTHGVSYRNSLTFWEVYLFVSLDEPVSLA